MKDEHVPDGFIALLHSLVLGCLLVALVFSAFAAKAERRPGPIYAFCLLASFTAATIPFALVYNDAQELTTFHFAYSAHSFLSRGAFIAWIFYLHALTDYSLRWSPRVMYAFEALRTVVFAAHPDAPYLQRLVGLLRMPGPFDDAVTLPLTEPIPWHVLQIIGSVMHLGYAAITLFVLVRIGRRRLAALLGLPFLLVLSLILVDNIRDSLALETIYLSELAFPLVVLALAASLAEWVLAGQRAREKIVEREAQLGRVLDSIVDGVVLCDRDWRVIRVNPIARELAASPIVGEPLLLDVFRLADARTGEAPHLEGLLEAPRDLVDRVRGENRLLRVSAGKVSGVFGRHVGYVVVIHDLTERAQRERQSRIDEKMRAIGELAGGIAHDYNNYLAAIGASARLLERRGDDPRARELVLKRIEEAVDQASSLTRRLLHFSRDEPQELASEREVVSLNQVVEGATEIFRSMLGRGIEVTLHLKARRDRILGDVGELQSVLLNIGKNAAYAIGESGSIRISTEEVQTRDGRPAVSIAISDTGAGIPPEDLDRIFEPFFSTKPDSEGSGLGLSSVHRIVKAHGGTIEVQSRVGSGTTFTLVFPLVEDPRFDPPTPTDPGRSSDDSPLRPA